MRTFLGLSLFVLGVVLAIYMGVFWMFIGGVKNLIDGITITHNSLQIAVGLARVMFAPAMGWLTFLFFSTLSYLTLGDNNG